MAHYNLNTVINEKVQPEEKYMVFNIDELNFGDDWGNIVFIECNPETWVGPSGFFRLGENEDSVLFVFKKNSQEFRSALSKMKAGEPWNVPNINYKAFRAFKDNKLRLMFMDPEIYNSYYN